MKAQSIWIGYDPREAHAFAVARYTIRKFDRIRSIGGVVLSELQRQGLYTRPTERRINTEGRSQLFDVTSNWWMSTEHANARFLVPHLAKTGWALFADADVMVRADIQGLFALADDRKALMCVHHDHQAVEGVKMDGQVQSNYARKNQSSVMLINCDHPSNKRLTLEAINTWPGRDLHRFKWLDDEEIGELPQEWNYLVGYTKSNTEPKLVHFTNGLPDMPGYENQEYADEWRAMIPFAVGAL